MSSVHSVMRRMAPLAVITALAAGAVLAAPSAAADATPAAPAKPAATPAATRPSNAGCTLSPSLTHPGGDLATCLAVGATLASVPAVGQTSVLTVTVKAGYAEPNTKVTIDLPPTLAFADGTKTSSAMTGRGVVARSAPTSLSLAKGDTRTFTRTVKAVGAGFGEIAVAAKNKISDARTDGGADSVFLTTAATIAASHTGGGADASAATPATTAATTAAVQPNVATTTRVTALPALGTPSRQVGARPATAGTSCVTGNWYYVDQTGTTRAAHNVVAQVISNGNVIASQYTGGDGSYNICWSTGGATTSFYVKFVEGNIAWEVTDLSGNVYSYSTPIVAVGDGGSYNLGGLQPGTASAMRGAHAYQEADDEYQWIYQSTPYVGGCWSPFESTCRQLVIHWQSDSTTGTYWNSTGAYLLAGSPDTLDEPVHEYGHALMYNLYGQNFPATTNCSPHYLMSVSSTTCGFTEGWADWVATSVYNNLVWTYNGGGTTNLDVTWNDPSGFDTGDQVEGRIVQAMRGLTDGIRAPWDNDPGEGFGVRDASKFFAVLRTYRPATFAAFWNGRAALGQDTSQVALSALYQGTIDYGFRNPLSNYVGVHFPEAVPDHNYSDTTSTDYWSVVAVKPDAGTDVDLSLYNDFGETSLLGSSTYGGTYTDFVAINTNVRATQTYYPRVHQFAGTGGYTIVDAAGAASLSTGTTVAATSSTQPVRIWDSYQTAGVPVYYKAVPAAGQDVQLAALGAGNGIVTRPGSIQGADPGAGNPAVLSYTPTVTGWAGLVLLNNNLANGAVTVYADTSAPTGSISINGGAASTASTAVTLSLSATDPQTGVDAMQISTDGVFDTEPVVAYSTSATATLAAPNGTKTVYARFRNDVGQWSSPVSDTIALKAAPAVVSLTPNAGPTAGGNTIVITGKYLTGTTKVSFGGVAAPTFTVVSDTKIKVKVPAGAAGVRDVRVKTAVGPSPVVTLDKYTYLAAPTVTKVSPSSGSHTGGTTVTLTGTHFTRASKVVFGTHTATTFTVVSDTKITVRVPAGTAGTVDVKVVTPGGTSSAVTADRYRYV